MCQQKRHPVTGKNTVIQNYSLIGKKHFLSL